VVQILTPLTKNQAIKYGHVQIMTMPIEQKIIKSLNAAETLYYRLVLLVGECGSGKTSIIQNVAQQNNAELININLHLSKALLEPTTKQRPLKIPEILAQIVNGTSGIVFLDNIEILFDVALKQDPLRLLQGLSRKRTVLTSWNGTFKNRKLMVAEPGHPEYRNYDAADILIVTMNGEATIDVEQSKRG